MNLKRAIESFFDGVVFIQRKLTGGLMLLMIITVSWQIIGRVILKIPTPWTEELAKLSLIWFTFIGSIGVLYKGQHLTVDLLLIRYKEQTRKYVRVFIDLVTLAFEAMLFVFGVYLCENPIIIKGVTTGLGISRLWLYLSLPVSMFFCTLISLYDLILAIADLKKAIAEKTENGGETI